MIPIPMIAHSGDVSTVNRICSRRVGLVAGRVERDDVVAGDGLARRGDRRGDGDRARRPGPSTVSWSNVTFQPLGGVAVSVTFSIAAVPVFVRMNCCWVALPAPPWAERRPPGVVSVNEYEPVSSTPSWVSTVWLPAVVATRITYWPAGASSGGSAVTLMLVVPPASTTVDAACSDPAISAVTVQSG